MQWMDLLNEWLDLRDRKNRNGFGVVEEVRKACYKRMRELESKLNLRAGGDEVTHNVKLSGREERQ